MTKKTSTEEFNDYIESKWVKLCEPSSAVDKKNCLILESKPTPYRGAKMNCHHCNADLSGPDTFYLKILGCRTFDTESTPPKSLPVPEGTPLAFCCMGKPECRDATVKFVGDQSLTSEVSMELVSNKPPMTKKERIDLCVLHIDTILLSCKLDDTNQYRWDYLKKMLESVA